VKTNILVFILFSVSAFSIIKPDEHEVKDTFFRTVCNNRSWYPQFCNDKLLRENMNSIPEMN